MRAKYFRRRTRFSLRDRTVLTVRRTANATDKAYGTRPAQNGFTSRTEIFAERREYILRMNVIWLVIMIAGTAAMIVSNPDGAITSLLNGATNSVTLALNLIASYGFWLGFFNLAEKTGISRFVQKILNPIVRFLFPGASEDTRRFVTLNMSANLLGLGNASTPMGVNAINSMYDGKPYATTNMIMLTVISATSLQLIPSTVIGMRIARGSTAPAAFLPASVVSTVVSTILGVALVKILSKILPAEPKTLMISARKKKTKRVTPAEA